MKQIKVPNLLMFENIKDLLNEQREVKIRVTGNSMLPFYKDNQTIVMLKKFNNYQKYDVVLALYQNKVILHRIIKIKDNYFILRGDGLVTKEKVNINNVFGKVVSFETNNKKVKAYKFKVRLWMFLRPFRSLLLKFVKKG